jgi:4-amino-4-deoxy-L-arabinose transferase-like glycosyltransferase
MQNGWKGSEAGPGACLRRAGSLVVGPRFRLVLVLGLAFALFVGTDQSGRTLSADTARYALVGREIVERGDPSRLTVDGMPYAKKPPLVFWLEAAAFSLCGFTEAAARLPSRVFGLASVALLMAITARCHGRRAAFWAGLAMATWHAFQRSACAARLDTALTFFTLASFAVFLSMDRWGVTRGKAAGLGGSIGLAVLAKGPPGLLGAAAIALGGVVSGRSRLVLKAAPIAVAAAVAVAAPWYVLQLVREGPGWSTDLVRDWTRSQEEASLGKSLALYGREFFLPAAAWLLPAALGAAAALGRARRNPRRALPEVLFLSLTVVLLAGLALRAAHHARYLIPLVPVFAFTAGTWLSVKLCRLRAERPVAALIACVVLVLYPLGLALGIPRMRVKYEEIARAAEFVRAADPRASVLPTWPAEIGDGISEATRFYFGLHMTPYDPRDPSQPPFVVVRHPERRSEFESRYGLPILLAGPEAIIYDARGKHEPRFQNGLPGR